jgi:hypothetical protein
LVGGKRREQAARVFFRARVVEGVYGGQGDEGDGHTPFRRRRLCRSVTARRRARIPVLRERECLRASDDARQHDEDDRCAREQRRTPAGRGLGFDQTLDSLHQDTSVGGDGQRVGVALLAAQSFERGECARVDEHVARRADGEVVAGVLALDAHAPGQPPHRRVIKEQGLGHALQEVAEVIVAAYVRQFVREESFELRRAQTRQSRRGHEDDGAQAPDDGRHFDERRLAQANRT